MWSNDLCIRLDFRNSRPTTTDAAEDNVSTVNESWRDEAISEINNWPLY